MKKKRAMLVLLCTLSLPLPSSAVAMDDMFSAMFRMMLVMMNVMSDAMLDNSSNFGSGSGNSTGFGMGSWPAMGGMSGMNPISGISGYPGMSPWPGMGGMPGVSPWPGTGGFPGSGMGMTPWSNPYTTGFSPYTNSPYDSAGYGGRPGNMPSGPVSLLDGRWFGHSGEILEVRGDRFRLTQGQLGIEGTIRIENNIVNLYSPQTGTVTQYTFIRNQSELMLQDASGQVLSFSKRRLNNAVHVF